MEGRRGGEGESKGGGGEGLVYHPKIHARTCSVRVTCLTNLIACNLSISRSGGTSNDLYSKRRNLLYLYSPPSPPPPHMHTPAHTCTSTRTLYDHFASLVQQQSQNGDHRDQRMMVCFTEMLYTKINFSAGYLLTCTLCLLPTCLNKVLFSQQTSTNRAVTALGSGSLIPRPPQTSPDLNRTFWILGPKIQNLRIGLGRPGDEARAQICRTQLSSLTAQHTTTTPAAVRETLTWRPGCLSVASS